MKKKSTPKKKKRELINLHLYGIFDPKKRKMLKVSLDLTEIQMELALTGGLGENLIECDFDVQLSI